jgi:hypothetical protein
MRPWVRLRAPVGRRERTNPPHRLQRPAQLRELRGHPASDSFYPLTRVTAPTIALREPWPHQAYCFSSAGQLTKSVIGNRPAAFGPARALSTMSPSSTSVLTRNRCPSSATSYGSSTQTHGQFGLSPNQRPLRSVDDFRKTTDGKEWCLGRGDAPHVTQYSDQREASYGSAARGLSSFSHRQPRSG